MRARALAGALFLAGCATARPERAYIVSSEPSYYSPVVRLAIAVDTTADSILVAIDSGAIRAHGIAQSAGAVMRRLTLEGLVVTRPQQTGAANSMLEPWTPLATSEPVALVDSLVFNVTVPVQPLLLAMRRPANVSLSQTWLVFRIRGDAVTNEIRMADGNVVPASVQPGGVRVYACSERNLAGTLDKERAQRLAREYATVC